MEFHILQILSFLSVLLVASHALETPDVYWRSVLPNSDMPKALKELLHTEEKGTAEGITKGGVGKGGVAMNTINSGKQTRVGRGEDDPKPFSYGCTFSYTCSFIYTSENQLKDNPNAALFFLEENMKKGTEMNLHLAKSTNSTAKFLPRKVADSIPFSSSKLAKIYEELSVKPDSMEAEMMKKTIEECEEKGIEGEEKYCATSLESMVDFSTSKLGKKVKAISTEVNNAKGTIQSQKYAIEGVKKLAADKAVVCHKQDYVYVVFYCHKTESIKAYSVSLVGEDGTKAKAVAVCHTDTAKWNPKHLAFQVLKVKPGTVPVCHFLPQDHIVWVPY